MSVRKFAALASLAWIFALIAGLCGCSTDEDEREPSLSEMLVGSWEIVSIEGEDLNSFISSLEDENEHLTIRIFKNEVVFTRDGSMFTNLGVEYILDSALWGIPVTVRMIFARKSEYNVSDRTLTTIGEDTNITVEFEPEEIDGQKLEDLAKDTLEEFQQKVRREFAFPIENVTVVISGNTLTLTLTDEDGDESVLKRE